MFKLNLRRPKKLSKHPLRHKILRILATIFGILLLLGLLSFRGCIGLWPWQMMETEPLTQEEIETLKPTFTRNYPDVIKGNWEPNANHMERLLVLDEDHIKTTGINTVSIGAENFFDKNNELYMHDEGRIMSNLARAKQKGFAVWIGVSFVGIGFGHDFEKKGITEEHYLQVSEEMALKWARIAEEFQVEFFDPQTELDFMIGHKFKHDPDETATIIEEWYQQMLPKLRAVYSGKIFAKIAVPNRILDLSGYDYVGMGLGEILMGPENFRQLAQQQYIAIQQIAKKSNAGWLVLEAWFPHAFSGRKQAESFRVSIEEYAKYIDQKPSGYFFSAWTMPFGLGIKSRPAEAVIRQFYTGQIDSDDFYIKQDANDLNIPGELSDSNPEEKPTKTKHPKTSPGK